MSKVGAAALGLAFALGAVATYRITVLASLDRARLCEEECSARGMNYLVAPAGTAGQSIDGSKTRYEAGDSCTCVKR